VNRTAAVAIVSIVAATGLVVGASSGAHHRDAERAEQRELARASAAVRRAARSIEASPEPARAIKVCPRGAEGLGNTARRSIRRKLIDPDGRVDLDALREMSNIAVASGRYLERKRSEPALPQRLGRERTTNADGSPGWEPLPYPKIGCALVPR